MFLKKYLTIPFVLLCIGMLLHVTTVQAQEGLSLRVQPSITEERVDPGQSIDGSITITNQDGGKQTYYITTRNVTGQEEKGTPIFESEDSNDLLEAASWIKPQIEEVTLEVNESADVPYRIDVPDNASPGSYFAALFITREANTGTENGAEVGFHVASLIILQVNGTVIEDMLFRELSTEKTIFTKPLVSFKANIENTGTIHQKPIGIIAITDMFGNDVGHITFNSNKGSILPKNNRVFEDAVWEYDGFALGKYTAVASLVYGDKQKSTITRDVSFWIIPAKEIGILAGGIVLFLLIVIFGIRQYVKSVLKKAGHEKMHKADKKNISLANKMMRTIRWLIAIVVLMLIVLIVFNA